MLIFLLLLLLVKIDATTSEVNMNNYSHDITKKVSTTTDDNTYVQTSLYNKYIVKKKIQIPFQGKSVNKYLVNRSFHQTADLICKLMTARRFYKQAPIHFS